jgi:cation diffusion facilitator family transporter
MHDRTLGPWQHEHVFGQDRKRPGESRTRVVIGITATMMVVEIVSGVLFGSMALLADGLHMASHASALTIALVAYVYARRHARDARFSFGAGKVNALGGFTGAVLLVVFALTMAWESVGRMLAPIEIAFDQAIAVAVLGLLVNGGSALILDHHRGAGEERHHDHNLRAAYLHVLADAVTSLLAILALVAGKFYGLLWMDPLMGIVGAALVTRWSLGLLRSTTSVLLDRQAPEAVRRAVREAIEAEADNRLADLHVWSIGPNLYSVVVSVVSAEPREPEHYKNLLPGDIGLVHRTVEVHRCPGATRSDPARSPDRKLDVVRAAARHSFPTAEIGTMLAEIERGYGEAGDPR